MFRALIVLSVALGVGVAEASTCVEGTRVLSHCICDEHGFEFWLRGNVESIDGGVTTLGRLTAANRLFQRPPDQLWRR